MKRNLCRGAVLCLAGLVAASAWAEQPPVDTDYLAQALDAAGENRAELERVLAHFAADPRKQKAARFLIENMPGHGYIKTQLRDAKGTPIAFDPLAYPNFKAALAALDELEKAHGALDFARDEKVEDVKTITAAFLIRHIDLAFEAWQRAPEARRVSFDTFLQFVLPYRGSQEPLDLWLEPLMRRWANLETKPKFRNDTRALYKRLCQECSSRVRFDERYYLHPTDQGFTEMGRTGLGRCEDITNMQTFAARSLALATAADYTPAWAHRDNNHAWNVLLDKDGRGFHKGNAHAAKVYRKTFALQRSNLAFRLPEGRKAPNRFLASTTYVDVTDQYAPTTDVTVELDQAAAGERFAYLCVFNGGAWTAIHWADVAEQGDRRTVTFDRMGRNIVYLPMVYVDEKLKPAGAPRLVLRDGTVRLLPGTGQPTQVVVSGTKPAQKHSDTLEIAPPSRLKAGATYTLKRWDGGWVDVQTSEAGAESLRFDKLPSDALYWLVQADSRKLERVFTIEKGRQRWW